MKELIVSFQTAVARLALEVYQATSIPQFAVPRETQIILDHATLSALRIRKWSRSMSENDLKSATTKTTKALNRLVANEVRFLTSQYAIDLVFRRVKLLPRGLAVKTFALAKEYDAFRHKTADTVALSAAFVGLHTELSRCEAEAAEQQRLAPKRDMYSRPLRQRSVA